jgi:2-dehydro-3-deoxygalactonokinase
MPQAAYIAIDWGTTSFRLWAIAADGTVLKEVLQGKGMASLKPGDYKHVLDETLQLQGLNRELPTLICGMAGARQGWQEAVYIETPASLDEVAGKCIAVAGTDDMVRIVPGLAQRDKAAPDVMRGEETQILGAVASGRTAGTFCMPGTHSKWVQLKGSIVTGFSTWMTGEVFKLLGEQSVLSQTIQKDVGSPHEYTEFEIAVRETIEAPQSVLNSLFSVRSQPLLFDGVTPQAMYQRLLGLLIGLEIAGNASGVNDKVCLVATGQLAKTYSHAFAAAEIDCDVLDANDMVRAGLHKVASQLWPDTVNAQETTV